MVVHTQKAALSLDAAPILVAHGRRGSKRSRHFTQFLTCRTTPQKVQGGTHNVKNSYPSRLRKHPQLHLAAEMARHPAAPGLLFTAAAVQGFSVVSKIVSNVVDKGSGTAETLSTAINRQLQQASNNIAIQTEMSQNSFQEWRGLMNGILSEEASKVQADLDHASKTAAAWQQHSSEVAAQVRDGLSSKPELKAHPLGLPQVNLSKLQSGWLVDALQERFPQAGSSSAWPTSFSVAAGSDSSSDSMSFSDDEDRRAASSPNFVSRFMGQARHLTTQLPDAARSNAIALDRNMSEFGSAASDLVTSVMSKAAQLPGQGFGISNFSPISSPERNRGRTGKTATLPPAPAPAAASPPPGKASALPTKSTASTAALPSSAASSPAAAPPSATASQPGSPHVASVAAKPATQKSAVSKLSPLKALLKASAGLPLVKTANSRQSIPRPPKSPRPPASPGKPLSEKLAEKAQALHSSKSFRAEYKVPSLPTQPSQPAWPSTIASSQGAMPQSARAMPTAPTEEAESSAMPSSASLGAGTAAAPASSESGSPASGPSPPDGTEAQGFSNKAADSDKPSAKKVEAATWLPSTAVAGGQGSSTPSVSSADLPVSTTGDVPQAKGGVPQARGNVPQAKGGALQSKGEGAQHTASAQEPSATGSDTKSARQQEQQPMSTTQAMPAHLPSDAAPLGTNQRQGQTKAKTPIKPVRVVRPVPTPNWRAPRPLTPPPTPVQQGHPLSAPPAQKAYLQTSPGQQGPPAADSPELSQDSAAVSPASVRGPISREDAPTSDATETVTAGTSPVSGKAPALQTSGNVPSAKQDQSQLIAGSSSGAAEKQQPISNAAAAAAVNSDSTTTVIDSTPWGSSGTATARGRQVSPQTGGGGGSSTGGTTGGGGGSSPRPSGDSGGGDDVPRSSSTWQQWWLGLLLVGGGATAVSMSSAARTAFMKAVAAIKARLAPVKKEEQQQEEGEVHEEEEEAQDNVQAELDSHNGDGIATNIKVKEGDTVWSIAEEYSGGGTAWPEVVTSNPHANTAKPTSGMSLRVSVRM